MTFGTLARLWGVLLLPPQCGEKGQFEVHGEVGLCKSSATFDRTISIINGPVFLV
jgi:hypothetical protein